MTETIYQLLDRIQDQPQLEVLAATSSLEFLQKVYSDPAQPINRRMRAAIAALPFEHPKLAVVGHTGINEGYANRLEQALKRSGKLIEAQPIGIEPA
jgi:hypothetical protein